MAGVVVCDAAIICDCVGAGSAIEIGVDVGGSTDGSGFGSRIAIPISTTPTTLEKILAQIDILGISISFAFTPPPNRPIRSAILPAIVRIFWGVIIVSF